MTSTAPLLPLLAQAVPTVGPVRLVCVDGGAGAGKSTLAAELAADLRPTYGEVPVVHADDLYEGWAVVADAADRVAAFARLAGRVDRWLLDPWSRGLAGEHPVRDWYADRWGPTRTVPASPVVILEGVGMASRSLRSRAALSVWVDADPAVALERVVARDGEAIRAQIESWVRDEARWHDLDGTRAGVDVRVVAAGPE